MLSFLQWCLPDFGSWIEADETLLPYVSGTLRKEDVPNRHFFQLTEIINITPCLEFSPRMDSNEVFSGPFFCSTSVLLSIRDADLTKVHYQWWALWLDKINIHMSHIYINFFFYSCLSRTVGFLEPKFLKNDIDIQNDFITVVIHLQTEDFLIKFEDPRSGSSNRRHLSFVINFGHLLKFMDT